MVSPHFPPDSSTSAHRVRLLAPHLPAHGWEPTVVAVDPRDCEARLDPDFASLVPGRVRVVRCRAWSARWTRRVGVGDLGLRSLSGLYRTCARLLRREHYDALFITMHPTYPFVLGPILKRRFGIPFVLDYQDPWVGAWGLTVGGGSNGTPDLKSRLSRRLAATLEPLVAGRADGITAVSRRTFDEVVLRNPALAAMPFLEIPFGGEPEDFARSSAGRRPTPFFDARDGNVHLCYLGTLLPTGLETLKAFLMAVALLRDRDPVHYRRLRLWFIGTSNQSAASSPARVAPLARALGVAEQVTEVPPRIGYVEGLSVLTQATANLLLGSSEPHYTASKLYPAIFAKRPLLAIYHRASTVVDILRRIGTAPTIRVVTYNDEHRAESSAEAIYTELKALVEDPVYRSDVVDARVTREFAADFLVGQLARFLDRLPA